MMSLCRFTLSACLLVFALAGSSQDYSVSFAGFNTDGSDFAPVLYENGVVICSNRNQKIHKMDQDSLQKYRTDLFFIELENLKPKAEAVLFSKEITTWLNEGPCVFNADRDYMIYTGNIEPVGIKRSDKIKEYKLGLFEVRNINGIWAATTPFPFNTKDNKYNIAHPALSPDGNTLVFSSNMPGSVGGADLFMCTRKDETWAEPINLGSVVNTKGNEFFPYFDADGKLYFASDGHHDRDDMDVYYTVKDPGGNWRKPIRLPEPLNSEFDDFAIALHKDGKSGFISSNRKGGGLDDIYEVLVEFPSFKDCREIQKPKFCYTFEDKSPVLSDTIPLALEWDLGDGNKQRGNSIKYCYADTGTYKVKLNLIDETTGAVYTRLSSTEIHIFKLNQPYISCANEMETEVSEVFAVTGTNLDNFDLEEYYWEFGDGEKSKGLFTNHAYQTAGNYRVTVGAVSFPNSAGTRDRICSYKNIKVLENGSIVMAGNDDDEYESVDMTKFERHLPVVSEGDSAAYYVLVKESKNRIPLNDPFFDKIPFEIRENEDSLLSWFRYTVGEGSTLEQVFGIYSTLFAEGYKDVEVRGDLLAKFVAGTTHKGNYIDKSDTLAVNREFAKFSHINFEYNSYEIMSDSYKNLDYIISMLKVSPDYRISIAAHTDIIGGDSFNQKLSDKRAKSVVDYFTSKGIDKKRIVAAGYGSSRPIADNETDDGRAKNRRVEFELLGGDVVRK